MAENLQGFILSIIGIALVLVVGFIVLGQLNTNASVLPVCQAFGATADWNGTTYCNHYDCVNNTHQTLGAAATYSLNSTRANCYNTTAYGAMNSTLLTATVPAAYNATVSIQSNLSTVPNWVGILITVALAFIVLGYFYRRD